MRIEKNILKLLSVSLSVLIISQNCHSALAKRSSGALKLRNSTINASNFDHSKNDLVIENANGLNPMVTVKCSDPSLKPVKIQGTIEGNSLHVDLSKLGPANELPDASYMVIARRGKKRLVGQFELNPSTLYVNRVSIPLSGLSSESKARVIRYHHSEEGLCYADPCPPTSPDEPVCLAPVFEVDCTDPSCNSGPCVKEGQENIEISCHCYDPDNLNVIGLEQEYFGTIEGDNIVADITLETTADYEKQDVGIEAQVSIDDKVEAELTNICFKEDSVSNTVENELTNATTAGTDIYLAANTEFSSLAPQDIDFSKLYEDAVKECGSVNNLPVEKAIEIAKEIATNIAQKIAEECKNALLETVGENSEMIKLFTEKAAEFAAKCPSFTGLPEENLINPEFLNEAQFNDISVGLLDPQSLGISNDSQVLVDLFKSTNVVPGCLQGISPEEAFAKFQAGIIPEYHYNPTSLATNFNLIKDAANILGQEIPSTISVISNTVFDPQQAIEALKNSGITIDFTLESNAKVEGQFDPSLFSGFNFNAHEGFVAPESFASYVNYLPSDSTSAPVPSGWTPTHDGISSTNLLPPPDATIPTGYTAPTEPVPVYEPVPSYQPAPVYYPPMH